MADSIGFLYIIYTFFSKITGKHFFKKALKTFQQLIIKDITVCELIRNLIIIKYHGQIVCINEY